MRVRVFLFDSLCDRGFLSRLTGREGERRGRLGIRRSGDGGQGGRSNRNGATCARGDGIYADSKCGLAIVCGGVAGERWIGFDCSILRWTNPNGDGGHASRILILGIPCPLIMEDCGQVTGQDSIDRTGLVLRYWGGVGHPNKRPRSGCPRREDIVTVRDPARTWRRCSTSGMIIYLCMVLRGMLPD